MVRVTAVVKAKFSVMVRFSFRVRVMVRGRFRVMVTVRASVWVSTSFRIRYSPEDVDRSVASDSVRLRVVLEFGLGLGLRVGLWLGLVLA
jgi:hypothetical protein